MLNTAAYHPINVLIVDDKRMLREVLSDMLTFLQPNWQVLEAENGKRGLELAQARRPLYIFTDFSMPILNGYEMALALQRDPYTRTIPLILTSGSAPTHPQLILLYAFCQAILSKPYDVSQLKKLLEQLPMWQTQSTDYAYRV